MFRIVLLVLALATASSNVCAEPTVYLRSGNMTLPLSKCISNVSEHWGRSAEWSRGWCMAQIGDGPQKPGGVGAEFGAGWRQARKYILSDVRPGDC
jgi:hypothetical protein